MQIQHHIRKLGSIIGLINTSYLHRNLIYVLAKRDINGRYKGALMGTAWTLITPLLSLTIYTLVFSEIFRVRWNNANTNTSKIEFALIVFSGMIVFSFFSEIITRSTVIITSNINYVKKVVFPLEILPIVLLLEVGFHALTSLVILITLIIFTDAGSVKHFYLIPILFLPLIFICLGLSFFLASIGVYVRDINQAINSITSILMFLTPIFFPLSAVPKSFQHLIELNPLTYIIETLRNLLFFDFTLNINSFLTYSLFSLLILKSGYYFFQKTRKGFSDVL